MTLYAQINAANGQHRNYRLDGVTDPDYAEAAAKRLMSDMGYNPDTGEETDPEFPLVHVGPMRGGKTIRRGINWAIKSRNS